MRYSVSILGAALVVIACSEPTAPSATRELQPALEIADARNGGAPGFYFLAPLAPTIRYAGVFDSSRNPVVEVCELSGTSCGATVARFSLEGENPARIRVDSAAEHYIVQWRTSDELSLESLYRIRVIDGSAELGHADVALLKKASDAKGLPGGIARIVRGSTLAIKFRIEVEAGGPPVRLEINPSTFILSNRNATRQLQVRAYDANGKLTNANVTWSSSDPATISVVDNGIATAMSSSGSSQIIAHAGSIASASALGIVMTPPAGALLIDDSNVVGAIVPVDSNAVYAPGWQYKVRLTGLTPAVGQILLSSGEATVGGRVVSLSDVGGGMSEVTLELIPMKDLFPNLSISQTLPMRKGAAPTIAASATFAGFRQIGAKALAPRFAESINTITMDLGPFECSITASGPTITPSVSSYLYHIDPDLSLDLVYSPANGLERLVVHGGIDAGLTVNALFPVAVQEKVECKVELATVHIPISGALALFVGGEVPLGVVFELGGKTQVGNIGFNMSVTAGATVALGFDCTAGCTTVATLNSSKTGSFAPVVPNLSTSGRTELSANASAFAKMKIGNPFINALQFEAFEAKLGLTQKLELANMDAQVADTAYASKGEFLFEAEAGTGSTVNLLGGLVGVNLATYKLTYSTPLATTPQLGTFSISPATIGGSTATSPGDSATFILTVDSVTYFGIYAVDSIELYRKKVSGTAFIMEKVPGNCGQMGATSGQFAFNCKTSLPATWSGTQQIYGFVKARIFGVPIPVLLELSANAKASVKIDTASVVVTPDSVLLAPGATQTFTASVTGVADTSVSWSATGGAISAAGVFTAGTTPGTYDVTATSVSDGTKKGQAKVVISNAALVTISPSRLTIRPNDTQQFTATVTGASSNLVSWSTTDPRGSVSSTGLYTAGSTPGVYAVTATSIVDPTSRAAAEVIVTGLRNLTTEAQIIARAHADQYGGENCYYFVRPYGMLSYTDDSECSVSGLTDGGTATASTLARQSWSVVSEADGSHVIRFTARGEGVTSGSGKGLLNADGNNRLSVCFTTVRTYNYRLTGSLSGKMGPNYDGGQAEVVLGNGTTALFYIIAGGNDPASVGPSATLDRTGTMPAGTYCFGVAAWGGAYNEALEIVGYSGYAEASNIEFRLTVP